MANLPIDEIKKCAEDKRHFITEYCNHYSSCKKDCPLGKMHTQYNISERHENGDFMECQEMTVALYEKMRREKINLI